MMVKPKGDRHFNFPRRQNRQVVYSGGAGGGAIRDGIVRTVIGCGWYRIELGTFVGTPDDIASASGSAGCSPCLNIVGAGTSGCAIEISPPASKVIGTGIVVTAYDPFSDKVLLVVGTDCLIAKTTGSTTGSASGSAQGSGTESSVWKVINGYHEHVVKYEHDGACCGDGGEWVTTRKKPSILIGTDCPWIDCQPCPSGSA